MLRFRADRRTLAFVSFYYVLLVAEWVTAWKPWYATLPLILLTCATSWICAVITHNSLHSPVFRSRNWNRAFQVALTCAYGFPVSEYVPGHNLSHHRFTQKRADLMRTSKVRSRYQIVNLLTFFPRVGASITAENYRYVSVMRERLRPWYRQLVLEMVVCWGEKLVLLALDWRKALAFVFVPHLFAVWGITTVNLFQHDGCDEDHPFNHSRNFVGRVFNWFTFNNGFHTVHHDRPGLHWSLAADAHRRDVHPGIHPALEQPSFAAYLFRTYVYPARRLRYDGQPLVLPPDGPDEDWIPADIRSVISQLGAEGTAMDAG